LNQNQRHARITLESSILIAIALMLPCAGAQQCAAPNQDKRIQVEKYVIARYKLSSPADVILTETKQASDACFWLLKFESSSPKREIAVYLSPDGNYLTPDLYDMRVDPLVEEKLAREQNVKSLLAGVAPELGRKDAPVTIAVFSDFQCPYCKRFAEMLEKDYLPSEADHVHLVFKNNPLPMHSWAMPAAEMAECVTLQKPGEFWKVHDFIFQNQAQITEANLRDKVMQFVAANVAIDQAQYQFCIDNDMAMGPVKKDMDLGRKLGVRGTPSIFINGAFYSGVRDAMQFRALVNEVAAGGEKSVLPITENARVDSVSSGRNACVGEPPAQSQR